MPTTTATSLDQGLEDGNAPVRPPAPIPNMPQIVQASCSAGTLVLAVLSAIFILFQIPDILRRQQDAENRARREEERKLKESIGDLVKGESEFVNIMLEKPDIRPLFFSDNDGNIIISISATQSMMYS